jgi:FKBP-type peptidyl-prolyl cis-trans isomerase FkpA
MKKSIYIIAAMAALFTASCGKFKTVENGVKYRILGKGDGEANTDTTALIYANYQIGIESTDSVLVETFSRGAGNYIPVTEPTLRYVLEKLVPGDSAEMIINADSFFLNSFGQPRPEFINAGDNIKFTIKVQEFLNEAQIQQKQMEELKELNEKDSIDRASAISALKEPKTTADGVTYEIVKKGGNKKVKKGDKVQVLYRGTLLNGQLFDENLTEGIELSVGLGQVIPGWESMLLEMSEGQEVKAFIPWHLAYGERGQGPIPPMSTLVFEMELIKIK